MTAAQAYEYTSINPYTEETNRSFPNHTDDEIQALLRDVDHAHRELWGTRTIADRAAVLYAAAALLRERADDLARTATVEMGKLIGESRKEVAISAAILDYYAEHAAEFLADRTIDTKAELAVVEIRSLGPIFAIEPWNFPYYQLARVVGPALAVGNTVLLKHAPGVPLCALAFEQVLADAGAPRGTYLNVFASNEQAADIIADERIRGVALTGSERAGTSVAASAGKALKKSTMELGGSDAFVVLDDADLDTAVKLAVVGRMNNAGQACAASKRLIVPRAMVSDFVEGLRVAFDAFRAGDPLDPTTTLAPLSSKRALELALDQVRQAVDGGARLVSGGGRVDRPGYFMQPTILTDVERGNPIYAKEFFAPVAMVFAADDEADAIRIANDTSFGLGGSVVTADHDRGRQVARRMDTGMVFVNCTTVTAPELPFGGVKHSGYGRELAELGVGEFVNKKLIYIR